MKIFFYISFIEGFIIVLPFNKLIKNAKSDIFYDKGVPVKRNNFSVA